MVPEPFEATKKSETWKGIPRENIEWHPFIDEKRCTGCGMCVTSCGRQVFDYNIKRKKAIVARPQQCMVGCVSCKVWCVFDAINFPDIKYIRNLIKENNVLNFVQQQLQTMLEEKKQQKGQ